MIQINFEPYVLNPSRGEIVIRVDGREIGRAQAAAKDADAFLLGTLRGLKVDAEANPAETVRALTSHLAEYFRRNSPGNFVYVDVTDTSVPEAPLPLSFILQRRGGKSPVEVMQEQADKIEYLESILRTAVEEQAGKDEPAWLPEAKRILNGGKLGAPDMYWLEGDEETAVDDPEEHPAVEEVDPGTVLRFMCARRARDEFYRTALYQGYTKLVPLSRDDVAAEIGRRKKTRLRHAC